MAELLDDQHDAAGRYRIHGEKGPDPLVLALDGKTRKGERSAMRNRFLLSCCPSIPDDGSLHHIQKPMDEITQFRKRSSMHPGLNRCASPAKANSAGSTLGSARGQREHSVSAEAAHGTLLSDDTVAHIKLHLDGRSCGDKQCRMELAGRKQTLFELRKTMQVDDKATTVGQAGTQVDRLSCAASPEVLANRIKFVELDVMKSLTRIFTTTGQQPAEREAALELCAVLFAASRQYLQTYRPNSKAESAQRLHISFEQDLAMESVTTVVELTASGLPCEKRAAAALLGEFGMLNCVVVIKCGGWPALKRLATSRSSIWTHKNTAAEALEKMHGRAAGCLAKIVEAAAYLGERIEIKANTVYYVDEEKKVLVGCNGSYCPPLLEDLESTPVDRVTRSEEEDALTGKRNDWNRVERVDAPEGPAWAPGRRCASTHFDEAQPRISDTSFDVIQMLDTREQANAKAEARKFAAAALSDLAPKHALEIAHLGGLRVLERLLQSSYKIERDAAKEALKQLKLQAEAIGNRSHGLQEFIAERAKEEKEKGRNVRFNKPARGDF